MLARLALEFAVCTRWFCSVPGETWPNRNFAHAATSDGETEIETRPYTNPTIFELLESTARTGASTTMTPRRSGRSPRSGTRPSGTPSGFRWTGSPSTSPRGDLPAYTFIEPNHRPPLHTLDHAPVIGAPDLSDSQHPENNLVSNAAYDSSAARRVATSPGPSS